MKNQEVKELIEEYFEFIDEEVDEDQLEIFLAENYPCDHESTERGDCSSCHGTGEGANPDVSCSSCGGSGVGDYRVCTDCGEEVEE